MQVSKRRLLGITFTTILISILLTSTAFYVFAPTSTTTIYVESGIYPTSLSYVFWRESSTYIAKGSDGAEVSSSSNITALFETVRDVATAGDTFFFKRGAYSLDSPFEVSKAINLLGEGRGTRFTLQAGKTVNMIEVTTSDLFIEKLYLDGLEPSQADGGNQALQNGIFLSSASGVTIQDCYIYNMEYAGIYQLLGSGDVFTSNVVIHNHGNGIWINAGGLSRITNNYIGNNGEKGTDGIQLFQADDVTINDNKVFNSWRYGIHVGLNSDRNIVDGNEVSGTIYGHVGTYAAGINVVPQSDTLGSNIISNNYCYNNNGTGITVEVASGLVITGNLCVDNDGPVYSYGIELLAIGWNGGNPMGGNTTVTGNVAYGSDYAFHINQTYNAVFTGNSGWGNLWGFYEGVSADYNVIAGNQFSGATGGIHTEGANTKVASTYNGTTWVA